MKSILTRLAALTLALAFVICLSSCNGGKEGENGSGNGFGTVEYPEGQEPVERPAPGSTPATND